MNMRVTVPVGGGLTRIVFAVIFFAGIFITVNAVKAEELTCESQLLEEKCYDVDRKNIELGSNRCSWKRIVSDEDDTDNHGGYCRPNAGTGMPYSLGKSCRDIRKRGDCNALGSYKVCALDANTLKCSIDPLFKKAFQSAGGTKEEVDQSSMFCGFNRNTECNTVLPVCTWNEPVLNNCVVNTSQPDYHRLNEESKEEMERFCSQLNDSSCLNYSSTCTRIKNYACYTETCDYADSKSCTKNYKCYWAVSGECKMQPKNCKSAKDAESCNMRGYGRINEMCSWNSGTNTCEIYSCRSIKSKSQCQGQSHCYVEYDTAVIRSYPCSRGSDIPRPISCQYFSGACAVVNNEYDCSRLGCTPRKNRADEFIGCK